MSPNQIKIPYIDDLLVNWHDIPGAHILKKLNHFDTSILLLSSYAIHLDKTIHWFEINFLKKFYSTLLNETLADDATQLVKLNLTKNLDTDKLCKQVKNITEVKVRLQLLFYFFDLAVADGKLHDDELEFIEKIKTSLAVPQKGYDAIFSLYAMYNQAFRKEKLKHIDKKLHLAFNIFGLTTSSSLEEVKIKYKEMVKLHHPDKVTYLGESHYNKATEMIKKINEAYAYIEKHFEK